jgi:anthranilate phosphoribosyltransferase
VTPEDFGVVRAPLEAIKGGGPAENAALIRRIFAGDTGPQRDIVVVNAAAALVAAGVAEDFREGARIASQALTSGGAQQRLAALVAFTNKS